MTLDGAIQPGDAQKFHFLVEQYRQINHPIQIVFLNSPGGVVDESKIIFSDVLANRIDTYVAAGQQCISACFAIFASGTRRFSEVNSIIGVHRANVGGSDSDRARSVSIDMLELYKLLKVPPEIQLQMISTAPQEVYFLTPQDKRLMSQLLPNTGSALQLVKHTNITPRPKGVTSEDRAQARRYNKQGILLINSQQYAIAINTLELSKSLYPIDAEVLGNLGYAYYMVGDLVSAQNNLTASLRISPKRGSTWNNLGLVLSARGYVAWAAESFVKYWNYSRNKKAATNQFFHWESERPGTPLEQASRIARASLGLYAPVN
ncbi:hypothetical protein [Serratia sp. JSRIV004]|nr:hypothetical protein [Serratia sp. JSRIV004]UAN57638.1 hypothetical protein KGP21_00610 [Serratia sp. JSRIV004]